MDESPDQTDSDAVNLQSTFERDLPDYLQGTQAPEVRPHDDAATPSVQDQQAIEQQKYRDFAGAIQQMRKFPVVTVTVIVANVLVYLGMGLTGAGWMSPHPESAIHWGADFWPLTTSGQWWRILTSAFVHFGLLHIAFNMWALAQAGMLTERLYGRRFYFLLYLYGALMSGLASTWWDQTKVSAGASGAIFAVFGGLLAYLILHRRTFPQAVLQPLLKSTTIFIGYNIFFGLTQPGISNSAHIGGLVSGFAMGIVLARPMEPVRRRKQAWPRLIGGTLAAVASLGAGLYAVPKITPQQLAELPAADPAVAFNRGVDFLKANPPDYTQAMASFRSAAAAGMPEAMLNVGALYLEGEGVRENDTEGVRWVQKSADAGLPAAQRVLAECYLDGQGVKQDRGKAKSLFRQAAAGGDEESRKWVAEHP